MGTFSGPGEEKSKRPSQSGDRREAATQAEQAEEEQERQERGL